jgi:lipopolysaccharide transport system ATP-binding protein
MDAVAREGRTVLFVSHNMAVIQSLCQRGVLLQSGQLAADGPVDVAVGQYLRSLEQAMAVDLRDRTDRSGWHRIRVSGLEIAGRNGAALASGNPARFVLTLTGLLLGTTCTLTILNNLGQPVCRFASGNASPLDRSVPQPASADGAARFICEVDELPLLPGRYRVDVLVRGAHHTEDRIASAAMFDVEPGVLAGRPVTRTGEGDVAVAHRWIVPVA